MIRIDELIALEREVWAALQTGDGRADRESLAADFLGVYPSGFATRDDHVTQLDDGPTVAEFELHDPRVVEVTDCDALLSYRAEFVRAGRGRRPETMYVSSLWSERDGRWLNVFSQDTPADALT